MQANRSCTAEGRLNGHADDGKTDHILKYRQTVDDQANPRLLLSRENDRRIADSTMISALIVRITTRAFTEIH